MTADNIKFDFQKSLKGIQEGKPFTGKDGVLTSLIKNLAEAAFEAELDSHLAREITANRRNGKTKKNIKSLGGKFELETPRDRNGTFSPKIVKKHQTTLINEIEQKIIALYGLYISESKGANFWLQVLIDLSNRGVQDILIACVDGLKGSPEAIESIFPKTEVQLCMVHQIRNSFAI